MSDPIQHPGRPATPSSTTAHRADLAAAGADAVGVLVFVLLGRGSHGEGSVVLGTLRTAWPFLTGAGIGWLVLLGRRASGRGWAGDSMPAGATVLGGAVAGGMLLRRLSGAGGTPVSFVAVATVFLTLALLGWRGAVRIRSRRA